jgi:hypothetical protein
MQRSFVVHYKNKYPNATIDHGDNHLRVVYAKGEVLVSIKRGGGGVILDCQKEDFARDPHDLSPIPKNARVYKLTGEHTIEKDELAAEREPIAKKLAETYGKVPSLVECKTLKIEVDFQDKVVLK